MLKIKELNLTCMINDSERITEKLGHCRRWQLIVPKKTKNQSTVSIFFPPWNMESYCWLSVFLKLMCGYLGRSQPNQAEEKIYT